MQRAIVLGVAGALMLSGAAFAQQTANVNQSGPANQADIGQGDNLGATAIIEQTGNSDLAIINQSRNTTSGGQNTVGRITQGGAEGGQSNANITQIDNFGSRSIIEQTNDSFADIDQIDQTGSLARITQTGNNEAGIRQTFPGTNNRAVVEQDGGFHDAFVEQKGGENNSLRVSQTGSFNTVQGIGELYFVQDGSNNSANFTQGGSENVASASQFGAAGNTLNVNQTSTGNSATVTQVNP